MSDWVFQYPCSVLLLGTKFSGKTNFLLNAVRPKFFKYRYIITQTGHTGNLKKIQDDEDYILSKEKVTEDKLDEILKTAKKEKAQTLLLLDDFIGQRISLDHSPAFLEMATSGRNSYTSVIVSTQYWKAVPTKLRQNMEYFVCFNVSEALRDHIRQEVLPSNLTKEQFAEMLDFVCKSTNYDYIFDDRREKLTFVMRGDALQVRVKKVDRKHNPLYDCITGKRIHEHDDAEEQKQQRKHRRGDHRAGQLPESQR